jgi:uncharacterized protein YjiS (DUF1127 family)
MLRRHSPESIPSELGAGAAPYSNRWRTGLSNGAAMVRVWLRRIRSRRELAKLEDRELSDIGISRAQARYESERPFWRP